MAVGFRIASAYVEINADTKGIRRDARDGIEKELKGVVAKVPLKIDSKGLRREVENALKEATKAQKPKVAIGIDSKGLRREVSDALKKATEKQKPNVRLGISSAGLRREVQNALNAATKGQKPTVKLSISAVGLRGEVQRSLDAATAGQSGTVTINARLDNNRLRQALADANPTLTPGFDVRAMRQALLSAIRRINTNDTVTINANIDGDLLRNQITSEVARLRDQFRVRIHPDVDTDAFAARMQAAARSVSGDIDIDLNPRINTLRARAEAAKAFADLRAKITFDGDLNTAMLAAQVASAKARLDAMGHNLNFRARVDVDSARAEAKLARIRAEMMLIGTMLDHQGHSFGRWGTIIAASLALGPPAIASLLPALRVTTTASMSLVSAFSELALVFGTVAVGGNGVVNAITASAEGGKKFAEAMERLTPTAREFVEAIVTEKGAFHELQQSVQNTLFDGLDTSFRRMAKTTIPDLNVGLGGTAMQLNSMTKQSMNAVSTLSRMGLLRTAFGGLQKAFEPLVPMPGQFLNMLTRVTIAGTPLLNRMTDSFGRGVDSLNDKVNRLFDSGLLQAKISKAGDDIVKFFRSIGNNPEWQKFVRDLRSNGPEMARTLGDITNGAMHLLNALHPISSVVVGLIGSFAKLVDAIPTPVLTFFITKLILFKVATKAALWVMGLTRAVAGLKLALTAINSQAAMSAILQTSSALSTLGIQGRKLEALALGIRAVGKAALLLGTLYAGKEIIEHFSEAATGASPDVDKLQLSIERLVKTGKTTGELKDVFGDPEGLAEGFKTLTAGVKQNIGVWDRLIGDHNLSGWTKKQIDNFKNGENSVEGWTKKVDRLDESLADLVNNGHGDVAAGFIKKFGVSQKDSSKYLTEYNKALREQKLAQELAAATMGIYGAQALKVTTKLDAQKKAADGVRQSIGALADAHRAAAGGVISMEQSIDDLTKSFKDNGSAFDENSEKGRQNKQAALDLAGATKDAALAKYDETGSWTQANKIYDRGYGALVKILQGMTNTATGAKYTREQAEKLAKSWIGIPDRAVSLTADIKDLDTKIKDAQKKLNNLKQKRKTAVGADKKELDAKVAKAQSELDKLKQKKKVVIDAAIKSLETDIKAAQAKVDGLKQKRKTAIGADKKKLDAEVNKAQAKVDKLKQKQATLIRVRDLVSRGVATAQNAIDALKGKTVTVTVMINGKKTGVDPDKYYSQGPHKGSRFGGPIYRALGGGVPGYISGPGGPTADRIPAMLSNGEFVIRAAAVSKYGMGLMNLINSGMFPKFAQGGSVGAVGAAGSPLVSTGTKTGTFTVTDGTGKPVASALGNFKALESGVSRAYVSMEAGTQRFGRSLSAGLSGASADSRKAWESWASGMRGRTDATYKAVGSLTNTFGRTHATRTSATSSQTQRVWDGWKSGMVSRTRATYNSINTATNTFSKQAVSRIGSARDGMGHAWGGLSPKFKPPVSYLVHTVLNRGVVGSMNAMISKLGGGSKVGGVSVAGFATGGPVYGAGSKTSDSIPARLSNGEFVMQAKAVDKFGVNFMNAVNNGRMPHDGAGFTGFSAGGLVGGIHINMPGYATGGIVGVPSADTLNKMLGNGTHGDSQKFADYILNTYVLPLIESGKGGSAMKEVFRVGTRHLRKNIADFVYKNFTGAGNAAAGLRWARTQYGKPYQWGGNGNPSWDCSGFMSAIESVIRGEKPHRRWATGAFSGATAPPGWKLNANAPFQIGITNAGVGHTAGTIGRENVESSGGIGVHGGIGVPRGASDGMFTARYGFVGGKARGGYISGPGSATSDSLLARLSNGEYVIRAAAVRKFGTSFLNAVNSGVLPGFASGGIALDTFKKVGKSGIQSTEGANALKGFVTLSQESLSAGKKDSEIVNAFQGHDTMADLLTDLWDAESKIRAAFKGKDQDKMIAAYEKTNKAAIAYQKQLDPINKSLEEATAKLSDLKESFDNLKTSVASSVSEFGKITKIGVYGTSPTTLLNQLTADTAKASNFASQLEQLRAKGVNADLIGQIADAGITGGGIATAQTVLSMTPEQLAQLNSLQAELTKQANRAGTAAANGMYGAGIQAAQGLVDGLTSQQKAIEAKMTEIAQAMEKAIKQALGIKSPSRVMMKVADFTADGLVGQLDTRTADVDKAMRALVGAPAGATAPVSASLPSVPAQRRTGATATVYNDNRQYSVTVDASGVSLSTPAERRALARTIVKEMKEEIRLDDRKRR